MKRGLSPEQAALASVREKVSLMAIILTVIVKVPIYSKGEPGSIVKDLVELEYFMKPELFTGSKTTSSMYSGPISSGT